MPKKEEETPVDEPVIEPKSAVEERLETLEEDNKKKDEQIEKLLAVANKGRLFNYESKQGEPGKKPFKVFLSGYEDGVIIGWRTVKDKLIKNPTTGLTVGEEQEYEVLVQDDAGNTTKKTIEGYPAFSEARYANRIEAEVTGQKVDWEGKTTLDVSLPGGKMVSLDSIYVN